jgi:hypothetical protein
MGRRMEWNPLMPLIPVFWISSFDLDRLRNAVYNLKKACLLNDSKYLMNKFQAMARIMAILGEDGRLKPGTREFKVARKIVSGKIDRLGSEAALAQAIKWKGHILDQVRIEDIFEEVKENFPFIDL